MTAEVRTGVTESGRPDLPSRFLPLTHPFSQPLFLSLHPRFVPSPSPSVPTLGPFTPLPTPTTGSHTEWEEGGDRGGQEGHHYHSVGLGGGVHPSGKSRRRVTRSSPHLFLTDPRDPPRFKTLDSRKYGGQTPVPSSSNPPGKKRKKTGLDREKFRFVSKNLGSLFGVRGFLQGISFGSYPRSVTGKVEDRGRKPGFVTDPRKGEVRER